MHVEAPWDYTRLVRELASGSPDLLDMGTGGGEWLGALPERPVRTIATEAWEPNVPVAAGHLAAVGIPVVRDEGAPDNVEQGRLDPRGRLAFRDGAFHLVVNRHEAFVAREVARVLDSGGVFLTQQVDNGNLDDCAALLGRGAPPEPHSWLAVAVRQLESAGFDVEDARTGVETYEFEDVGALAWYLQAVGPLHREWSDFRITSYRDAFARLHGTSATAPIVVREKRLLLQARRGDRPRDGS
jgi:SAM-dependent methyltransferase